MKDYVNHNLGTGYKCLWHIRVCGRITMFCFNRVMQLTAHYMQQSIYCAERFMAVYKVQTVIAIGQEDTETWYRGTSFCEVPLKKDVMPTNQRHLSTWLPTNAMPLPRYQPKTCTKIDMDPDTAAILMKWYYNLQQKYKFGLISKHFCFITFLNLNL